ncbi:hypothetical protein [Namhaeicola litoreus]|uniref:Quercetin 2,3-dioxygenase C-terminal cupin domain-containing protein n=1 Tax=Namhaeicola litoreus TaxID=1052145 RepID=A0ABW3Y4B8_9FLAO
MLICVEGDFQIQYKSGIENLKKGETMLLPAALGDISFDSRDATVLEVYL